MHLTAFIGGHNTLPVFMSPGRRDKGKPKKTDKL